MKDWLALACSVYCHLPVIPGTKSEFSRAVFDVAGILSLILIVLHCVVQQCCSLFKSLIVMHYFKYKGFNVAGLLYKYWPRGKKKKNDTMAFHCEFGIIYCFICGNLYWPLTDTALRKFWYDKIHNLIVNVLTYVRVIEVLSSLCHPIAVLYMNLIYGLKQMVISLTL